MKTAERTGAKFSEMRRHWRNHLLDAALIILSLLATLYTGSQVAAVWSDLSFRDYALHGQIPAGATNIPYHNPWNRFHPDLVIVLSEPMTIWDWLSLFSPVIIPCTAIGLEILRYHQWKKTSKPPKLQQAPEQFRDPTPRALSRLVRSPCLMSMLSDFA